MRAEAIVGLFVIGALGGCLDADTDLGEPTVPLPSAGLVIALQTLLDPGEGRDREAHLAAHPTEPGTILVTWRSGEFGQDPDIWAAVTTDAGASWNVQELTDPSLAPLDGPSGRRYAYDSTAAFGPDGTAYVLFGGERPYTADAANLQDRLTLARSQDDGATWEYVRWAEAPFGVAGADYPDLAVAPDTGYLYAVAQVYAYGVPLYLVPQVCSPLGICLLREGIWLARSMDGGTTWSEPIIVYDPLPTTIDHYLPRVVAGPDGLVIVSTNAYDPATDSLDAYLRISRDGGDSFEPAQRMYAYQGVSGFIHDPVAIWSAPDGAVHVGLVFNGGDRLVGLRSADAGRSWGLAQPLLALDTEVIWLSAAAGRDGSVWAEYRYGDAEQFGVGVIRWDADGTAQALDVVTAPGVDGQWIVGDDYGAFDVAADGSAWAAWSDLRGGDDEWIGVASVAFA